MSISIQWLLGIQPISSEPGIRANHLSSFSTTTSNSFDERKHTCEIPVQWRKKGMENHPHAQKSQRRKPSYRLEREICGEETLGISFHCQMIRNVSSDL
jgi:predicted metal-dependent phosphoesterase TrpH